MIKVSTIVVLLVFLLPGSVQAIKVPGLYEAEVVVPGQSEELRKQALETALRIVLIKLTGDRQAAARTALSPLLIQAEKYLQQYRYRDVSGEIEIDSGEILPTTETRLWVRFDEETLNQALRDLSVPVWGRERPSTLLWLAVADETGRRLVGLEDGSAYISPIDRRAQQRGIALLYPLLDLDDSNSIRASDIWGGFRQPVINASSRYQADTILTGAIESPVSGIWEARWTAYIDSQMASWTSESDLLDAVLEEGIDKFADILATRFARTAVYAGVNQVRLTVADIFNVDQYAGVLDYLSSLNSVSDVEVVEVEEARVTFLLQAHGGELAVSQAIGLGRILESIGARGTEYRLLP